MTQRPEEDLTERNRTASLAPTAAQRAAFLLLLNARLEMGAEAYSDVSFERPAMELIEEIQQEVLDMAGWGYVLWERLERLKVKAEGL